MFDPPSPAVNQKHATVIPYGGARMGDGGRDEVQSSTLENALREMMAAAGELPVPQHLVGFIEALEDEADPDQGERKTG